MSCASFHWPLFCRHSLFHMSPSPRPISLSSLPLPIVSRFKSPPSLFSPPSSSSSSSEKVASPRSEELPIRIARRVRELTKLPHDLGKMPSIIEVRKLYEKSFFQIRKCPKPKTNEQEEKFTKILDDIMVAHNSGEGKTPSSKGPAASQPRIHPPLASRAPFQPLLQRRAAPCSHPWSVEKRLARAALRTNRCKIAAAPGM